MLPLFVLAAVAFGTVASGPACAQTQPQIQTLGRPGSFCYNRRTGRFLHWGGCRPDSDDGGPGDESKKPSAAEKRVKRAACLKQAERQGLHGPSRSAYVRKCMSGG